MLRQALRSLAGGSVEIEVRLDLDANGNVTSAAPLGSAQGVRKLLAEFATDAARHWRFEPARRNGQPVPSSTVVPFRFVPPSR